MASRDCEFCGGPLGANRRRDARFCSERHRAAAWREGENESQPPAFPTLPTLCSCERPIPDWDGWALVCVKCGRGLMS